MARIHSPFYFLLFLVFSSCSHWKWVQYRRSDNSYERKLEKRNTAFTIQHHTYNTNTWRFLSAGDSALPTLVVIHGAPGSISTFDPLLFDTAITNHIRILAMDRPGYGYNNFGNPDTSVLQQAKDLHYLIHHLFSIKNYAVLGYSYGGPVAATLASIDTAEVRRLYLVSAALIQGQEKIYGISHALDKRAMRVLVPSVVCAANDEKLSHYAALGAVMGKYANIHCPIDIYHGAQDKLIYTTNVVSFSEIAHKAHITTHYTTGGHHAFIWNYGDFLKNQLRTDLL